MLKPPMAGPKSQTRAPDHVILYDADCGFCKWSLNRVLSWDRRRRLRPVAIQSEEGQTLLSDFPPRRHLDSWHLGTPTGEVVSAGTAAAPLLALLPGGRPLAALLRAFPDATERAYRWVARHRDWLATLLRIDERCEVRER